MNILETLFLSCVFILFPLYCYYIYVINEQNLGRKTSDILFDVALFSSLYLLLKIDTGYSYIKMMFISVPLLIAYLRGKKTLYIVFSFLIGLYNYYMFNISVHLIILELLIYFIMLPLLKRKDFDDAKTISSFVIIKIVFVIYVFDYFKLSNMNALKEIIIVPFAYYFTTHLICFLIIKSEKIMCLHLAIKELEKEKQLRDSLFKITHEIKNPLAVCKGYFDMLDTKNEDHIKRYIPIIRQEIERTLTIINDFMNLTKLNVNKKKMDISLLLNDISEIAKILSTEKKIDFVSNVSDKELYIYGDYDRLKQVFINILKNAIEAIPSPKKGTIKLSSKIVHDDLLITISDNGIGMDKQTIEKVGEAFFTTKKNGTGLGIKLSKEILDAHAGSLQYKSNSKEGTKSIVSLPLKKSL